MQVHINYLDLFSGAGGFAKGLLLAGFSFKQHYYSEIDTHAIANYHYNYKKAKALGNITKIRAKDLGRIDLITFGSPCQDISIAGKRRGIKGSRSSLFFEAVRLIRECKPGAFIFENVKGLFSSNKGKDFETVLKTFADIGLYNIQWQLLNTRWFLPQNRERIYLVGTLREKTAAKIFPIGHSPALSSEAGSQRERRLDIASTLTKTYSKGVQGMGATFVQVPEATRKGYAIARHGDSINLSYLSSNKKRGRIGKQEAHTLATGSTQYTLTGKRIRRLTPVECERLQGFPDHWTGYGIYEGQTKQISDTQRYILLGNAVSVPVVKAVSSRLHSFFTS